MWPRYQTLWCYGKARKLSVLSASGKQKQSYMRLCYEKPHINSKVARHVEVRKWSVQRYPQNALIENSIKPYLKLCIAQVTVRDVDLISTLQIVFHHSDHKNIPFTGRVRLCGRGCSRVGSRLSSPYSQHIAPYFTALHCIVLHQISILWASCRRLLQRACSLNQLATSFPPTIITFATTLVAVFIYLHGS